MKKIDHTAHYTEDSEWIRPEGNFYKIGISDFAQEVYGKMTTAYLPAIGTIFQKGRVLCELETNKSTSEVLMPVNGKVVAINTAIAENPSLINESPYELGWLVKIEVEDDNQILDLMTGEAYRSYIGVLFNK